MLEKINPLWRLFDFHSSVSCLEVQLFLSQGTDRGFSVHCLPGIPEERSDGTGVLSSLAPSSTSEPQKDVSERERERTCTNPPISRQALCKLIQMTQLQIGNVSFILCLMQMKNNTYGTCFSAATCEVVKVWNVGQVNQAEIEKKDVQAVVVLPYL